MGVLTGMVDHRFSISVNYRSLKGTLMENLTMGNRRMSKGIVSGKIASGMTVSEIALSGQ